VCASCHGSGALGAPKFESKGDWGGRLGQGYDTLVKHAIQGLRQMPPRGGDDDLSDIEVARAVAYMANSAGASFKEPAAPVAPAPAAATPSTPATAASTPEAGVAPAAGATPAAATVDKK